jgi:predicted molibdopterin-dependent oxidoreductase YjgC
VSGRPNGKAVGDGTAAGNAAAGAAVAGNAVDGVRISFDGMPITARAGITVGAVLTDAGIRSWRSTRIGGARRGLFCGIGVCFDCLITVDGVPNQRACLVPVADGMRLTTGEGDAEHCASDEDAHG